MKTAVEKYMRMHRRANWTMKNKGKKLKKRTVSKIPTQCSSIEKTTLSLRTQEL